jgi:AraC-like DNA-binding protein
VKPISHNLSGSDLFASQVTQVNRFLLPGAGGGSKRLSVVSGGREQCLPDYRVDRDDFPFFSIEFVARGRGTLTLAGARHPLSTGSVFTYGPGVAHQITTEQKEPMVKYFVDFSGARAKERMAAVGLAPGTFLQVSAIDEIQRLFEDLIANGKSGGRYSPQICTAILEYLSFKIAERGITEQQDQSRAYATYEQCRRYIQEHFARLDNLAQIAEECHIDPAYLCRLFRRFDEQTPHQVLIRRKMNHAAERLRDPEALVKQVARELGFADAFAFSRTFKRVFGLAPDRFRRLR